MKNIASIIAIVGIAALSVLTGCKSKDSTTASGSLFFHIHTNIDTTEAELDQTYALPDSAHTHFRNITVHAASYTITNVKMVNPSNQNQEVTATVHQVTGVEDYSVGTLPVGIYKSITFDISNLSIQGNVDTSAAGNGTANVPYSFQQSGTVTVSLPDHGVLFPTAGEFVFTANQATYVHMIGDVAVLLKGIDLRANQVNNATVTAALTANIPSMIHYEE